MSFGYALGMRTFQVISENSTLTAPFAAGRAGNLQTLRAMRRLVLSGANDKRIRDIAIFLTRRFQNDENLKKITTLYEFVRDKIDYVQDPITIGDKVQSPFVTLNGKEGDCGDLVVLLASLLGAVGYKARFALLSYQPPAFQHVFVEVQLVRGDWLPLDPTADKGTVGYKARGMMQAYFPIFDDGDKNDPANLGGLLSSLIQIGGIAAAPFTGGASIGIAQGANAVIGGVGASKAGKKAEETARDQLREQAYSQMTQIQAAVESGQISKTAGVAQAQDVVSQYYGTVAQFTTASVKQSAENFRAISGGFNDRIARVQNATVSAPSQSIFSGGGSAAAGGLSISPMVLLAGAAGLILLTR